MTVFQKIDYLLVGNAKVINLYTNFATVDDLNRFVEYCKSRNIRVIDIQISKIKEHEQNGIIAMLILRNAKRCPHVELIQDFGCLEGLKYIEEI